MFVRRVHDDLLRLGAARTYLLLTQPYSIGDEIVIGDRAASCRVDILVTRIESAARSTSSYVQGVFHTGIVLAAARAVA